MELLVVRVGVHGRHEPLLDPELVGRTLAIGATQFVVQDAFEIT